MKEMDMEDYFARKKTVEEEVMDLDIDKDVKERIIAKLEKLIIENTKQSEYLYNRHNEIESLKKAIISQAKVIGHLEEEIRKLGIKCD